jgi:hypothetical protein
VSSAVRRGPPMMRNRAPGHGRRGPRAHDEEGAPFVTYSHHEPHARRTAGRAQANNPALVGAGCSSVLAYFSSGAGASMEIANGMWAPPRSAA